MKNFYLFLIGIMFCGVMTAQTNYNIQIAGTDLTSANAGQINNSEFPNLGLTEGTITYDHSAKTFTLTNVNALVTSSNRFIYILNTAESAEYKINLVGNNLITTGEVGVIVTYRNLTIEGDGLLYITSSNIGIFVGDNSTLYIKNTVVDAHGSKWGIVGNDGTKNEKLVIENSTVKAYGNNGSICDFQSITYTGCDIFQPEGAAVANNGSNGQAVMLNGTVVTSEVIIAQYYGIQIAGTKLTSVNAGYINNTNFPNLGLVSGTITYDHSTSTFTLENVKATVTSDNKFMYISNTAFSSLYKINLVGNNVITTGAATNIAVYRDLTIKGDGSLDIISSNIGFYVGENSTLYIENTVIDVVGKWGITGYDGTKNEKLVIENSTVKATGSSGSICDLQSITHTGCDIVKPEGAAVANNGSNGQAVMLNGTVVTSEVIIAQYYGIQIAGTKLTSVNAGAINNTNFPNLGLVSSGTITYNHSEKTITLTNVKATVTSDKKFIDISNIAENTEYKINLVGNNVITTGVANNIVASRNLTIEGNGSLDITSSNVGIFVGENSTLYIKNTIINVKGKWGIMGIYGTSNEKLLIGNSTVKVNGDYGSICDLQSITHVGCDIVYPEGAAVANNGSYGQAVMLNGSVVDSEVIIEPPYGIQIAGKKLNSVNAGAINNTNFPNLGLTEGAITYDHIEKTITLINVITNVTSSIFIDILSIAEDADYKINLIGNSVITVGSHGIWTSRNLTVEGNGSLEIVSSGIGFCVNDNSTLHIKNTKVEVKGVFGIKGITGALGEILIIENSTVKATGSSGSICNLQSITHPECKIIQPEGAAVANNGSDGQAVMLNGSVVTSEVILTPGSGVNDIEAEKAFSIYPNPASNLINIISENANELITISDLSGKVVYSELASEKQNSIDISQLSAGMYIVRIGEKATKFVKE